MIGGKVIETLLYKNRIWVNTQDRNDTCAIYVEDTPESRSISEGDSIWWQGGYAYWTAKSREGRKSIGKPDYRLKRIGFSGVKRPQDS